MVFLPASMTMSLGTKSLVINTRSLSASMTGTQRYVSQILCRLDQDVIKLAPRNALPGFKGHLWEQIVLPFKVGNHLLWSPANTGPLIVRNQVLSILDMSTVDHPEWFSFNFAHWYRFLLPTLARRVRRILTISNFSRNRIADICQIDVNKIVVTYLAADSRFFRKTVDDVNQVKAGLNIPAVRYILAVGSQEPRKNLGRLLKAWERIQPELPEDIWLVLVGARGNSAIFRDVSFENLPPRVHFTGHVVDEALPALYSGADAFIYPSLYEGFGLPPLEAMACGTPVIVSNTTSLPEVVADSGLYVNPLDIENIADAIKQVITDGGLRLSLQKSGVERSKLFSWERTTELTRQALNQTALEN
jgi:glycosyltransferase involved in cell wall biosynthesis